jgi:hypothetical protein
MRRRNSILDSAAMLVIIGILAGAIGGMGIGLMSKSTASTTSSAAH